MLRRLTPIALAAATLAAALSTGAVRAQGIPVYDNAANLRWAMQLIDNAQDLLYQLEQIQHAIGGLQRMDAQFAAITGDRGMGSMLRNVGLDRYVPAQALESLQAVSTRGFAGMTDAARALRGVSEVNPCAGMPQAMRVACQAGIARPFEQAALLRQVRLQQDNRIAQLRGLLDAISTATDPARREQLTARLVGEQAVIAQAEGQVNTMRALAESEERMAAARRRQATLENLNRTTGLVIRTTPMEP